MFKSMFTIAALVPNQRHSVAYLPDGTVAAPAGYQTQPLPQSRSYHDYYDGSRSGSATPTASESESRSVNFIKHIKHNVL